MNVFSLEDICLLKQYTCHRKNKNRISLPKYAVGHLHVAIATLYCDTARHIISGVFYSVKWNGKMEWCKLSCSDNI